MNISRKENMKKICGFLYKYRHAWLLSYAFIYLPWFMFLERTVTRDYHIMHASLDDLIPFNEYFIVPYFLSWKNYSTVNFEKQGESQNIKKLLFYFYFCYGIFIIKK